MSPLDGIKRVLSVDSNLSYGSSRSRTSSLDTAASSVQEGAWVGQGSHPGDTGIIFVALEGPADASGRRSSPAPAKLASQESGLAGQKCLGNQPCSDESSGGSAASCCATVTEAERWEMKREERVSQLKEELMASSYYQGLLQHEPAALHLLTGELLKID